MVLIKKSVNCLHINVNTIRTVNTIYINANTVHPITNIAI